MAGMAHNKQQDEAIKNLLAALLATRYVGLTPGDIGNAVATFLFHSGFDEGHIDGMADAQTSRVAYRHQHGCFAEPDGKGGARTVVPKKSKAAKAGQ
jgi:hypothetical protein